jgi:hypothetical protein
MADDKEGALHLQASGRWAIMRPGREPFELTSDAVFRVEVSGKLQVTAWGTFGARATIPSTASLCATECARAIGAEALPRKKR